MPHLNIAMGTCDDLNVVPILFTLQDHGVVAGRQQEEMVARLSRRPKQLHDRNAAIDADFLDRSQTLRCDKVDLQAGVLGNDQVEITL